MSRRSLLCIALLVLAGPATARAQVTFSVHQELGTLPVGLGPYFLVWTLNDLNPAPNSVTITNFSSNNLTFVPTTNQFLYDPANAYNAGGTTPVPTGAPGAPNIVNPDFTYYTPTGVPPFYGPGISSADVVFGSVTTAGIGPGNPAQPTVFIFQDPAFLLTTQAWQQIAPTGPGNASIDFTVTVSTFYDPNFPADTFTFNLAYTDPSITVPWQIGNPNYTTDVQTLGPTGKALVFAELTNTFNYTNVQTSPIDTSGGNDQILANAGLTAASVLPEPGTMVIWGTVFGISGLMYRRRKLTVAATATPAVPAA